jgi:ketosteroid isomerase-like protein
MSHDHVMLEIFGAVERRDPDLLLSLYHPEIEFLWPPTLPYGGTFRGREILQMTTAFAAAWDPVQLTEAERSMDPVVIGETGADVVIRYHQRGRRATGEQIDAEVVGCYHIDGGKLARAQMFYFDTAAVNEFLRSP